VIKEKEILVNTGEVKFSNGPAVFSSRGIGSCIVLFIYDPKRKNGGVAHIMLPSDAPSAPESKFLFADKAVGDLLQKLTAEGSMIPNLKAKIVGGANMFEWAEADELKDLGKTNIEKVKKELLKHRVYLAAEAVGGSAGKTVKCYTDTGKVHINYQMIKEEVI
jgi:chemotaxis protein CheD